MSTTTQQIEPQPKLVAAAAPRSKGFGLAAGRRFGWLLAATIVVYGRTLVDLTRDWWQNPDYSHGFLIVIAVAYFVWQKRERLAELVGQGSWLGLPVVAASQGLYFVGFLGAEFFLQRISLLVLLAGMIWFIAGARLLRELTFEFLLLLLAIPLPAIIFNALTMPLQLQASAWAESILRICNVPVLREGNVLELSTQALNVTEACSGMRSLMSLLALGLMLTQFLPKSFWARLTLVVSVLPISLSANALRVAGTGIIAQTFGEKWATGFFHLFSGWVVFLLAFALLMFEMTLIRKLATRFSRR